MVSVKYPYLREELIESIAEFADQEFQRGAWLKRSNPHSLLGASHAIEVLWDVDGLELLVADIFIDLAEAAAATRFKDAFTAINELLGPFASDREYMKHPLWSNVVVAARGLHRVMVSSERPGGS